MEQIDAVKSFSQTHVRLRMNAKSAPVEGGRGRGSRKSWSRETEEAGTAT